MITCDATIEMPKTYLGSKRERNGAQGRMWAVVGGLACKYNCKPRNPAGGRAYLLLGHPDCSDSATLSGSECHSRDWLWLCPGGPHSCQASYVLVGGIRDGSPIDSFVCT
jgi:hypothetical protein